MAVKIRLTRIGRHKDPIYRIVASDHKFARDGRYIEHLGYYDPSKGIENATINEERVLAWLDNGAQYSDTIKAILSKKGLIEKHLKSENNNPKKEGVTKTGGDKKVSKKKLAKKAEKKEKKEFKAKNEARIKALQDKKAKELEEASKVEETPVEETPTESAE